MSVAVGVGKTARDISSKAVDPKAIYMGCVCVCVCVCPCACMGECLYV